jgi:hypothetical protein
VGAQDNAIGFDELLHVTEIQFVRSDTGCADL